MRASAWMPAAERELMAAPRRQKTIHQQSQVQHLASTERGLPYMGAMVPPNQERTADPHIGIEKGTDFLLSLLSAPTPGQEEGGQTQQPPFQAIRACPEL